MKKEMIKAIRMVKGFNTDLRVNLKGINENDLFDWIHENYYGIFGLTAEHRPTSASPDWMRYERKIMGAVRQVISGKGD